MYGVRQCSSFILLQVVDQFSQHHLLKEIVFSPLYVLASFVKDKVSIGVWVYLWTFFLIPLVYISVLVLEKTSESPLGSKEVKLLNLIGDQP